MSNFKIARLGYNVNTAPDWALLFNSDWPSLTIAFETTITGPASSQTIVHNLGFPPLSICYISKNNLAYGRSQAGNVTSKTITVPGASSGEVVVVRCYNIDISKEATYPLPASAAVRLPYNSSYGAKIAKKGRSIASHNLNDFILHTRSQSPAVLHVATEKGPYYSTTATDSHNAIVVPVTTSYIPWAVGAVENPSGTYTHFSINGLKFINKSLVFDLGTNLGGSLIVLRDPLIYPNAVEVIY